MKYQCNPLTDLDELIGHDEIDGFHAGPLVNAMKHDEPLELIGSAMMSLEVRVKIAQVAHGLIVPETGERLDPPQHFSLVLH